MKYYEQEAVSEPLPDWVVNSIRLGYLVGREAKPSTPHIYLISSPFESTIAPLIALGAMRASLENAEHSLCSGYFSLLHEIRGQLLRNGKAEDLPWNLKKSGEGRNQYRFATGGDSRGIPVEAQKMGRGRSRRNSASSWIMESSAISWKLDGFPVPRSDSEPEQSFVDILQSLPGCSGQIHPENLRSSFLGHALVCSSAGDNSNYRDGLRESGFCVDDEKRSLSSLLMLEGDDTTDIRRLSLIGERQIKDHPFHAAPAIMIADGARALLNIWSRRPDLAESTVIGVVNRSGPSDSLEGFKDKLRNYRDIHPPVDYASPYIRILSMERKQ